MSTIKTMTIDEIRNYKITEEDRLNMQRAKDIKNFDDCPPLSKPELSKFKPHSKMNKNESSRKVKVDIMLDTEIVDELKHKSPEYGTLVNSILRAYLFG